MTNIRDLVKSLLATRLKMPIEEVKDDANIVDDLGADSMTVLVLVSEFENQFDIRVSDEELENLNTVDEIVARLTELCDQRSSP